MALLFAGFGGKQAAWTGAVHTREKMASADKAAEQTVPVNVAAEVANAPPSEAIARFPVFARCAIEVRFQMGEVGVNILPAISFGKELAEGGVVGQVFKRCDLKLVKRDVRRVEIDRRDRNGRGGEIAQNVAAARGNGDEFLTILKLQCFEVDERILPDLRINQPAEGEREKPLLDALPGRGLVAMDRLTEALIACAPERRVLIGYSVVNCGHAFPVILGQRCRVCRSLAL